MQGLRPLYAFDNIAPLLKNQSTMESSGKIFLCCQVMQVILINIFFYALLNNVINFDIFSAVILFYRYVSKKVLLLKYPVNENKNISKALYESESI